MNWTVAREAGPPSTLHAREVAVPASRTVTFLDPDRPALVVGRAQRVDGDAVRRPSGGGAVWLAPGEQLWADVVVPRADALWDDDVNRAAWWLGDVWAAALSSCAVSEVEVHRGPLACGRWGPALCFAGIGAGEVTVGGRKAVGISQRRTRHYALFQCAVPVVWDPAPLVEAMGLPGDAVDELRGAVWSLDEAAVGVDDLAAAFVDRLP